ncbi:acyl dehydratase [Loktanella sp. IMCC34160]|uniref:FAS1-like dehydratase domain-containing protein n=1 Tax=Loktanella sp. IMCC34160 TaxID=2510646 RepID=UPI00101B8835|nr:MaoC family dehydratase N-terminal domain-containing protein [Loktanella sp. IMCC34160]RYG91178.1 acyl dehydratase [Loktanella sp. IMCC34160]
MTQTCPDSLDPARATAMQAMLGDPRAFEQGDALPPFYHQLYFWDPQPPARLGRDGHPATGIGLIPDMGLPRRMWAGGSLRFHSPLLAGIRAEKRSSIESSTRKDGRSGPLAFVRLRHDYWQRGSICLTEWQDLVYREDPGPDAAPPVPPQARTDETTAQVRSFDETALFRYSALTFNGHRIHYDVDYARAVEGYTGLVVHGPLLAQMLMHLAEAQLGGLTEFTYRATSPLIAGEVAAFCWADGALWVRGADGRQCMEAAAR